MAKKNIKSKKSTAPLPSDHTVDDGHDHDHDEHDHGSESSSIWRTYAPVGFSLLLLLSGLALEYWLQAGWFAGWVRLAWYLVAYAPVGFPVIWKGIQAALKGDIFTEFLLMGIATVGAFAIGEYPEGVAVMLFYAIGELFQDAAVNRAKRNIKALLDVRPDQATVLQDGQPVTVKPDTVNVGDTIRVKPGERVPLDGTLSGKSGAAFDTAALTGESKPRMIAAGETVLAGMVSAESVVEVKVTKPFGESSIARILELVQNATARKAPTELFIRKFARVYTPIVVLLAVLLVVVPYFVAPDYVFRDWLYRALIFLVISCPCALVISIPLGYFGGIGAASRQGILFKGSNFLDLMTKVNTVVMDKTGTLTHGVFKVQKIESEGVEKNELLLLAAALEQHSTHPVAKAMLKYADKQKIDWKKAAVTEIKEIAGHGLTGQVNGKPVIVGNTKLLEKFKVTYPPALDAEVDTIAVVSVGGKYAGFVTIADEIKPDAADTVKRLHAAGIREIVMLSGDKDSVVQKVIGALGIEQGFGDLLPEGKVERVEALKRDNPARVIAFMGDGLNDAPVLAVADVGIAMGGLGSDAAIETADVIIQNDEPSKAATAIAIGRMTRKVVWQNIGFAFGVKVVVLALGAGGLATMWEAVFADVGVAFLAILNAVRIQRTKF
ncbi:MAG: heavy metal translocating P-type ATPase [Saprospiraceae bacterium]|nr:heavy metal translocating P-type ATPase [Saprospiraceae bacterium]MCC6280084.1 heavy metal translocating P-type ATPase [Saprospiraceae bacterium]